MAVPTRGTKREWVLGQPVDAVSRDHAVSLILGRALDGAPGAYVCLTNVHTTVESQRMDELRDAAERSFLSVPDGIPLVWMLRNRGHRHTEKVTGIELVPMIARAGVELGLRHFFYGGAPNVGKAAARRLRGLVPGATVVGAMAPPFGPITDHEIEELAVAVADTRPHIVWVGLGAPKQELFMARAAERLGGPVLVGVGAAFDFLAGTKRPAPRWMRHGGLEWLFRLASEPRRLWRRYLIGNSVFGYLLVREALAGRGWMRREGPW